MIYRVEELLQHAGNDRMITDEGGSLSYSSLQDAAGSLEHSLGGQAFYCIHFPVRNRSTHIVALLYLLARKINIFLTAETAGQLTPPFCDAILEYTDGRWELRANLVHHTSGVLMPGDGKVVFASSGTTSLPKFIMYQSHKLLSNALAVAERFKFGQDKRVLIPVPVNHMYGFGVGLLPAVAAGADIRLIDKNDVIKLCESLHSFRPDIALLTPSVCKMLLLINKRVPGQTLYITAGDKMQRQAHETFETRFNTLVNLYGCTELGAIATSHPKAGPLERIEGVLKVLGTAKIAIRRHGKAEIQCRHEAGFEAYINSEGGKVSDREKIWFCTKDVGVKVGAGKFKVLGRMDHCIKRLGLFVQFAEIEALIEGLFDEIQEVIVVPNGRENIFGGQIIACCQTPEPKDLDKEYVRRSCREKMPKHMVPDDFWFIDELPRLLNGKPDRLTLQQKMIN